MSSDGHNRIHDLILDACARYPEATSLSLRDDVLTYRTLLSQSLSIQQSLAAFHGTNALVGIFMERSFSFFVSVIGILLSGLAYVPVSTKYGTDRIQYILGFSAPVAVLSCSPHILLLQEGLWNGTVLDAEARGDGTSVVRSLGDEDGHDLAYIIFTSGTTGRPKGVMVEHCSVCNMMKEKNSIYQTTTNDKVLQFYNVAFDGSVIDYLPTLSTGATLVLWSGQVDEAIGACVQHAVTHAMLTSSTMALFETMSSVKLMAQGGEACPLDLAVKWSARCVFCNFYGPTEATGFCTWKRFQPGATEVTIGRTIRNASVFILDADLAVLPEGQVGELCFGGVCLARGYLKDSARTQVAFVETQHGRLYRTGDMGLLSTDGDLICKGRKDDQVKVRGVRIELQEVEQVLTQHASVQSACCVVHDSSLVAFVVPSSPSIELERDLMQVCAARLAQEAVPSAIFHLKELPLTSHGKADKKALAQPIHVNKDGDLTEIDDALKSLAIIKQAVSVKYDKKVVVGRYETLRPQLAIFFQLFDYSRPPMTQLRAFCRMKMDIFDMELICLSNMPQRDDRSVDTVALEALGCWRHLGHSNYFHHELATVDEWIADDSCGWYRKTWGFPDTPEQVRLVDANHDKDRHYWNAMKRYNADLPYATQTIVSR